MPLSEADVAEAATVMKRFWPQLTVDDVAVRAWHLLFSTVIDDAETLKTAVLNAAAAGSGDERELGARILQEARDIVGVVEDPWAHLHDYSLDHVEEDKRRMLAAAGVTEQEFEARRNEPGWIEATFPRAEIEARQREEWLL